MAKTTVASNAKEFTRKLNKVQLSYHLNIMKALTENANNINKMVTNDFMIKLPKGEYNKNKLAIRSGFLASVFKKRGSWDIKKNAATFKGSKFLTYWIRPQIKKKSFEYVSNLAVFPRGRKAMEFRLNHEDGRGKNKFGNKTSKKPFFEPSVRKGFKMLDKLLVRKLKKDLSQTI